LAGLLQAEAAAWGCGASTCTATPHAGPSTRPSSIHCCQRAPSTPCF
jgi:hypothetical protein